MRTDFIRLCNDKGPTLVLVKVKETGRICGGFTSVSWHKYEKDEFKPDSSAVIFSVDSSKIYELNPDKAVCH